MSNTKLKLMVSVFSRRIEKGETFIEIATDYPKLSNDDLKQIEKELYYKK